MFRDLGDFQTPPSLVGAVLDYLYRAGRYWTRVLEPTCGRGNFIHGLLARKDHPEEIQGIELQTMYIDALKSHITSQKDVFMAIKQANIFDIDFRTDLAWKSQGPLLVIGNPPWVTNSELSTLASNNFPRKSNVKNLAGFEAMTGSSNFDIAEFILLKLIRELVHESPRIALLCKTLVARNVIQYVADKKIQASNMEIRLIDAKKWFRAAVDACLFCIDVGQGNADYEARVYKDLESSEPMSTLSFVRGRLVSNVAFHERISTFDGISPLEWRSGLKHDVASIVELTIDELGLWHNRSGEVVQVEPKYLYPFFKSSDLAGRTKNKQRPTRAIIVPQKHMGDDTKPLEYMAPQLWKFLVAHREDFDARKSSIYRNQPPFAYLGIGDYTFAPFKVAISGMYKTPVFRAIGPVQGKPMLFDDTCYFLPCSSAQQAALIVSLLNHPITLTFLHSIAFWDSKRPITKKVLQRIDLTAILNYVDKWALLNQATRELDVLEGNNGDERIWPESLGELLSDNLLRTRTHAQLSLFD